MHRLQIIILFLILVFVISCSYINDANSSNETEVLVDREILSTTTKSSVFSSPTVGLYDSNPSISNSVPTMTANVDCVSDVEYLVDRVVSGIEIQILCNEKNVSYTNKS